MILSYEIGDSLYLNITNRCDCACVFCVRKGRDSVTDGESLWLEREPGAGEVVADLEKRELERYSEICFCGYGEPTENLDVLISVAKWIKRTAPGLTVRLNTNGLCDLSYGKAVAPLLSGLVDSISISLNAPDPARYREVTRPRFGEESYEAMLRFAESCKEFIPQVQFTVVDILSPEEIARCEEIAEKMKIPLRVRGMID